MRKSVVERTAVLPKFSTLWQRVIRAEKWVRPVNRADGDEMGDQGAEARARQPAMQMKARRLDCKRGRQQPAKTQRDSVVRARQIVAAMPADWPDGCWVTRW